MALWIEVRCTLAVSKRCKSAMNAGPKEMALHRRSELMKQVRRLEALALQSGWCRQNGTELACMECVGEAYDKR